MKQDKTLIIAGLGYAGRAVAEAAAKAGWRVIGTSRQPESIRAPAGVQVIGFEEAGPAFVTASHWLITTPPDEGGDPVLRRHAAALVSGNQRWIGYLSTTGVYGDRAGGVVDEATAPAPGQPRSQRRLAAEQAWRAARPAGTALDICRVGGIYGPGRAPFAELRAGLARRVVKPGHSFSRIHRDDIAHAVMAAINNPPPPGCRVLNFVDDVPAESATVMEEAARLLGMPAPPAIPFEEARAGMSPMALSFWSENRRVANAATKAALGIEWRYPSYREGLAASLGCFAVTQQE
ncbi:MAG: SDR family oxidoreductase [Roseomonas sp.]|nr:SDR family oxidoreductase [Roseomonas sp.]